MYLSNQSLIVIVVVGVIAGWIAGQVVAGGGFGFIGDLIVGILGAFIGDWLLPRLGVHFGVGLLALIVNAAIGAIVLLLILRLLTGGWRRNPGWGWRNRRW
ncbi:MAG TPA: GlsB/YeaQ/YmgE family stress response membrane protein [Roseiarcus sp.]|nr:GlsB/YeaQ/YmgE family stress response membrane protein [Roseiarcus sp.]